MPLKRARNKNAGSLTVAISLAVMGFTYAYFEYPIFEERLYKILLSSFFFTLIFSMLTRIWAPDFGRRRPRR